VPFGISLAILGGREMWLSVRAARQGKYPPPYPPPHAGREGASANPDESSH
jgi:hypothetical protein